VLPAPNAVPTPNSDPKRASTSAQVRRSVNVRHIKMHYFTSHVALNTYAVLVPLSLLSPVAHMYTCIPRLTWVASFYARAQPEDWGRAGVGSVPTHSQPNPSPVTSEIPIDCPQRYGIIPGHDGPDLLADPGREHLATAGLPGKKVK